MLALRSAPPVLGIAEAERAVRDEYGSAASLHRLPSERDCNFHVCVADGREFVLKIIDAAAGPGVADRLVGVLRHLAECDPGLNVPRVHLTRHGAELGRVAQEGVTHATCLMSYLPGRLLSAVGAAAPPLLHEVGAAVARLDRALRGFFHPTLAQPIAWDVRRLPDLLEFLPLLGSPVLRRAVETAASALTARLPSLRALRGQAIHGDCHAGNLLIGEPIAITGVLDFGDMVHAPLAMELAVTLAELLMGGIATAEGLGAVIEGYTRAMPLETAEVEVLFDLVAARLAATVLLHAWRRAHDPTGARLIEGGAAAAGPALQRLLHEVGVFTTEWHRAAGTEARHPAGRGPASVDLDRRQRLLGAGAELFYATPLHLVRGEDVWLFDATGRPYLDVYNNVPHVGHCHPTVVAAIQRQTACLVTHTRYLHAGILDYAEALTATLPGHLDTCVFVNSGSEANDLAWRLAQFGTGNGGGMVMSHAYHGITESVAALTPGAGDVHDPRVVTLGLPPATLRVDGVSSALELAAAAADVERGLRELSLRNLAPAAWFIDTALTSSGIFDPSPEWMAVLTDRVRAAGGLVVADEVQFGLGRSGSHRWGFERRGLSPDIVTLGKPVGNGYPMGVVIARRALIEAFQARHGFFSTFGGSPVAAAAGLAVLRVLEREQLTANAHSTGEYLRRRLTMLAAGHACLGAVRGAGLLLGLEVVGTSTPMAKRRTRTLVEALARAGVLTGSEGPLGNIVKLRPPMSFRPEHADFVVQAIDTAAAGVDAQD